MKSIAEQRYEVMRDVTAGKLTVEQGRAANRALLMSISTTDQTYCGWTNYATWGVALVLDNDEATYRYVRDVFVPLARRARPESRPAIAQLADAIKDLTENLCGLEDDDDHLSLMARQVIQAGLSDVDWTEIARVVLSEDS